MLKVQMFEHAVHVRGHAGFAGVGQDIVCAAVSTLFFTLAEHLSRRTEVEDDIGSGYAYLRWEGDGGEAVEMFRCGVEMIAEQYPDCVELVRNDEGARKWKFYLD